ncbi:MAG TPA: GNAT family N-acetyltransferase [Methylomusa anaerophila]|uniref:GNAT acetyltransferase n=1 Tax=Methylomusa anaerophila TaxID=1930071 RepID=A0A348AEQ7_9FIRM|nr:GNAT family N-acetyltransferase [Methylomusa anaerophila]BBB89555.1 GNAT acetyltransferase [Methylomusa anaerophila]HML90076.1 GNAT family N-acetyltransferase [Methylomusa anaerophila]
MVTLYQVTPENRNKVECLLVNNRCYDMSVDSILEGQAGGNIQIVLDNQENPKVVQIIQGTFTFFGGDANCSSARELVKGLLPKYAVQPANDDWLDLLKEIHKDNLYSVKRYSFSSESLRESHLRQIIDSNPNSSIITRIDLKKAHAMNRDSLNKFHFINYNSPEHFIEKGFGYCAIVDNNVVSACTTALVCKKGIEICIISQPKYRRRGFALLTAAQLVLHCLENGMEPHWDAANTMSRKLAEKVGYTCKGSYEVYKLDQNQNINNNLYGSNN